MKGNIIKKLSLYYYTFVDLLELKDAILQLFTAMDANQCRLNIVSLFFMKLFFFEENVKGGFPLEKYLNSFLIVAP